MTVRRGVVRSRPLLAAAAVVVVGGVLVSAAADGPRSVAVDRPPTRALTVIADASVPAAILVSRTVFESSPSAVVIARGADAEARRNAYDKAVNGHVPVFDEAVTDRAAIDAELARLGVSEVDTVGDRDAVERDLQSGAPSPTVDPAALVLVAGGGDAVATAKAAGLDAAGVPVADPRASGEAVAALKSEPDRAVVAIGQFGDERTLVERMTLARTVPELPGGGQLVFPGRRMVALYGSPGGADLGPLGAQGVTESIRRVRRVAAPYRALSDVPVVPAFEIIVTVASADPGYRGQYTNIIDPSVIKPWVDAAGAAGVYVTLDLQPGRMDFLTQAKMYRELLKQPHVGLALDPEWRLTPEQVHLTQIGAVDPAEVNRTADWLAELVRTERLPQKAFVLHQFDADMLGDRTRLDTSHPELATVIHADGHGTPGVKRGTWRRIIAGLPPNVWLGWKNFYKEDTPMFSPARTLDVRPEPWFISYQ